MFNGIFKHADLIQKGLDASWKRNEVIANNLANADTPGFKRSDVVFESVLKDASEAEMKATRPGHFSSSSDNNEISVVQDNSTTMKLDGNNVDIEKEAADLAKNTIWYNYMIQKISKEFGRIKMAINEGK